MYEADPLSILKRHESMESDRLNSVETVWRDCYDYTYPIRGNGLSGSDDSPNSGQSKQARLFDNTAGDSVNILASNIIAGMTPANALWFGLDVGNETPEESRWLSESADILWQNIHMGNFDAESFEGCLDVAIAGQFVLYVDEDREVGGLTFEHWPLSECYFGSTRTDGRIDIVHRKHNMTAEAAAREFGENKLPEKIRKCAKDSKKSTEVFEFLHCIYPRAEGRGKMARNLPIASVHIAVQDKVVVRDSGYHEMPVVVPRWLRVPKSMYAIGPMYTALPDVRQINYLKGLESDNASIAVSGMWIAKDDGILNPRSIKIGAKKIVVAADVDSMKALQTGSDFQLSEHLVSRLSASIRKTLMADQLVPQDGPQMTAEEVRTRTEMIRKLLGPIYGRLQAEYLTPLVTRCFGLAFRAGVFSPPPQSLQGRSFSVRYVSPMARAQRLDEVAAIQQSISVVGQMAAIYPSVVDEIDPVKAIELITDGLGAPASIRRSEEDKRKVRAAREQQQSQSQQQAMGQQVMQAGMAQAGAA